MSIITNNLPELAASIRQEHHLAEQHAMQAVNHAMEAGRLLIEAKALCSHGKWLSWLADNFEGSARTAQAYMRLYENRDALANTQSSAHLSIDGALKLLAEPKEAEPATKNDTVSHLPGWLPKGGDMALCVLNWIDTDMASEFVEVQQVAHAPGYYYVVCLIGSTLDWTHRGVRADYVEEYIRDCLPGRAIKGKEISDLPWESGPVDPNYLYDATIKPFNQLERSEEAAAFAKRRRAAHLANKD